MDANKPLNANHLKLIAILAMTNDHAANLFYPGFPAEPVPFLLHFVGRLTAPIMWFFVCEGYHYTKDLKQYMLRLGSFALVSHFAYCFCFGISLNPFEGSIFNRTSVMYPLFIAVLVQYLKDRYVTEQAADRCLPSEGNGASKDDDMPAGLHNETSAAGAAQGNRRHSAVLVRLLQVILVLSAFPADWSCIAVLAILEMYQYRGNLERQMLAVVKWTFLYGLVSFFFVSRVYAIELVGVLMVYPVLKLYNGERGKAKWMKWFFYLYYPAHLVLIGIIRIMVYGNVQLSV